MSDFSWEHLLQRIDQGVVVPIVGPDLLQIEVGGKKVLLYTWLATQLAERLGVKADLTGPNPLNTVATAHLEADGELDSVYLTLTTLVAETSSLQVPEPLRKLAEIRPLKLFLTTTFDPMLQRALDEVRFDTAARTKTLSFLPKRTDDITPDLLTKGFPIVFHLLGRADRPDYAVTEEDTLEYVSALQSDSARPKTLFDELDDRFFLIIGNTFCDWLARFFIRSAKRERLSILRSSDFVADNNVRNESTLLAYLLRFSKMKIFTTAGPIDFIDELHRLWTKEHQDADPNAPAALPARPVIPGSVFISYATEDRETALNVRDRLDSEGIDVWLDVDRIGAGDTFDPTIARAIDSCAVFMPILSKHSLTDQPRYFNLEWKHALTIDGKLNASVRFIMPLRADGTPYNEPALPQRFRELSWQEADDEFPRQAFLKDLRDTMKRYRSAATGRVA